MNPVVSEEDVILWDDVFDDIVLDDDIDMLELDCCWADDWKVDDWVIDWEDCMDDCKDWKDCCWLKDDPLDSSWKDASWRVSFFMDEEDCWDVFEKLMLPSFCYSGIFFINVNINACLFNEAG